VSLEIVYETHSTSEDNEAGSQPGRELGERRRDDGISRVFASDLRCAVETAEIAFAGSPLPLLQDARLRECDCDPDLRPPRRGPRRPQSPMSATNTET
jgi:2,3-bisphosphoglycerate-dependent phosphoglycerate mutase